MSSPVPQRDWRVLVALDPSSHNFAVKQTREGSFYLEGVGPDGFSLRHSLPIRLYPQDVSCWWRALLEANLPHEAPEVWQAWENRVTECLDVPNSDVLTIILGKERDIHLAELYHVRFAHLEDFRRQGNRISFDATIEDMIFAPTDLRRWSFTIFCDSVEGAESLVDKLCNRALRRVAVGEDVRAIIARNDERWEAVGLPSNTIIEIAQSIFVSLEILEEESSFPARNSFRVTASA